MSGDEIYVIDSNVVIHAAGMELPFDNMVTVPEVTAEMESFRAQRRFEAEDIDIREPSDEAIENVEEQVDKGEESVSQADIKLVALALDMEASLVTDDYWMQNLAQKLGINCRTFLKEGIQETKSWKTVCTNCGRRTEKKRCPVCGGSTKKKSKN